MLWWQGVCQPLATWGWLTEHAVNDTMLAPVNCWSTIPRGSARSRRPGCWMERCVQPGSTAPAVSDHVRLPLKSKGRIWVRTDGMPRIEPGRPLRMAPLAAQPVSRRSRSGLISLANSSPDVAAEATRGFAHDAADTTGSSGEVPTRWKPAAAKAPRPADHYPVQCAMEYHQPHRWPGGVGNLAESQPSCDMFEQFRQNRRCVQTPRVLDLRDLVDAFQSRGGRMTRPSR